MRILIMTRKNSKYPTIHCFLKNNVGIVTDAFIPFISIAFDKAITFASSKVEKLDYTFSYYQPGRIQISYETGVSTSFSREDTLALLKLANSQGSITVYFSGQFL